MLDYIDLTQRGRLPRLLGMVYPACAMTGVEGLPAPTPSG